MNSRFLIDYLTVTSKIHSPQGLMELFGLDHLTWEVCSGANSYRDGYRSGSIRVSYNGITDDMGVCIDLSGQGCREFETLGHGDYERVFSEVLDNKGEMNITRLDIAFDDKDGLIDWGQLCWDTIARDGRGKPTENSSRQRSNGESQQTRKAIQFIGAVRKASSLFVPMIKPRSVDFITSTGSVLNCSFVSHIP